MCLAVVIKRSFGFAQLHCCGVENFMDWKMSDYFKQKGIPISCCKPLENCTDDDLRNVTKAEGKVYEHVSEGLLTFLDFSRIWKLANASRFWFASKLLNGSLLLLLFYYLLLRNTENN